MKAQVSSVGNIDVALKFAAEVLLPPSGYLKRLREIAARHGILLIFDEAITGFGRLGRQFVAQHFAHCQYLSHGPCRSD